MGSKAKKVLHQTSPNNEDLREVGHEYPDFLKVEASKPVEEPVKEGSADETPEE